MHNARITWAAESVPSTPSRLRLFIGALRYLISKALTIILTIYLGVFITILLVNYPIGATKGESPFQLRLETQISYLVQSAIYDGTIPYDPITGAPDGPALEAMEKRLRTEAGLDLPYLLRNLYWTAKALSFNWGELNTTYAEQLGLGAKSKIFSNNIVLEYLPNTLLLMGAAYLLVFLIGMPLSLQLARKHGSRLDRFFAFLSPISSVPGWVFGLLGISLFAVQLRWLPVGGMFDFHKPDDPFQSTVVLVRHMLLPVSALVVSLLFQLIYAWRTFFIIYSEEDYVELARAKGLEDRILERQYILRPALPYIITSFTTSLIGFWQIAVAIEVVFQWPGAGLLYIKSLPNYFGDSMRLGDLMIVIQVVVVFAYLLGLLVFLLDSVYMIVDPRIRLLPPTNAAQKQANVKQNRRGWSLLVKAWRKDKAAGLSQPVTGLVSKRRFSWLKTFTELKESLSETNSRIGLFIHELRRYPSAIFGLSVITILLIGSAYAVLALPYEKFGREFDQKRFAGHVQTPRLAAPEWTNVFSATPQLSTLILDEHSPAARVVTRKLENGWVEKTVTFTLDYIYQKIPSDVYLYLTPKYSAKIPFVSMVWTKPDGKTINLKALAQSGDSSYDFDAGVPVTKLLNQNPAWKTWFVSEGQYPTPAYELLFAQTNAHESGPQRGRYTLAIQSLLFEPGDDLQPQLILLGQVYGAAGTDYWRRDLIIPLFWGMPFTLLVGFLGTLVTTLVAILLPAIGVWFGGGLDAFIQRLTDINMVLPGLAIVTLANAIFGIDIWILLAIVVILNAFGSPIKTFRSALLQAKEAPYMEVARAYGASNFRIITRYLVPRILPVLIPQMITQIPSFIFLEATLGLFNIKSIYPTWGRIIYDGLASNAMYGSPFWVLEPISLLLITGLAFALLGSALERILNPRVLDQSPALKTVTSQTKLNIPRTQQAAVMMTALAIIVMTGLYLGKTKFSAQAIQAAPTNIENGSHPIASTQTRLPATVSATSSPLPTISATTPTSLTPSATATLIIESSLTPIDSIPQTYILHAGEYPFCLARRFDVDINELLTQNQLTNTQTFFAGMALQIPQTGKYFKGNRILKTHPAGYTVSSADQSLYTIACAFGDVDPLAIAQANDIPVDSKLLIGQQLNIP